MLAATTIGGVVTAKDKQWLTLLLDTGKREKVKYLSTDLCIGDEVLVAFNHVTSIVAGIYNTNETIRTGIEEPIPKVINPLLGFDSTYDHFYEEWECSRSQDFEDFEDSWE